MVSSKATRQPSGEYNRTLTFCPVATRKNWTPITRPPDHSSCPKEHHFFPCPQKTSEVPFITNLYFIPSPFTTNMSQFFSLPVKAITLIHPGLSQCFVPALSSEAESHPPNQACSSCLSLRAPDSQHCPAVPGSDTPPGMIKTHAK